LLNIGVLISWGGSNLQSLINSTNCGYIQGKISVVISDRPDAYGIERARNSGIPVFIFDRSKMAYEELNYNINMVLKSHSIDLVVLAGYLSILSKELVREYKNAIINIHPSLIPSFCGQGFFGLKVHKSVIDYGVKVSGCTVHFVDEGTDTGPIILQKAVEVMDTDTPEALQERILEFEHKLLPDAVKLICEGRISITGRKVKIAGGGLM
jgi:phosphoribosylglycinamide formyltransferase-1